ncbi:MAG TPA: hypothetical protein PLM72_12790 [Spirochaetota bacterium]|nr:hypothetical protein [Spirochaetota bacterium]
MLKFQISIFSILITGFFVVILCQTAGIKKTLFDDKTGQTYNNFRSDSTESVFYQVQKPDEFLYSEPKYNSDPVYTLDDDSFLEYAGEKESDDFLKVRVFDKLSGVITGWVRTSALKKEKYFARSFESYVKAPPSFDNEKKKNPHWIKNDLQPVYADSTMQGTASAVLKKGHLVYLDTPDGSNSKIYFTSDGILSSGYIKKDLLSELALISDASNDLTALFKKYDPVLLRNDIDKAAFISYNGINFINKEAKEFTEDKICKEKTTDTLSYRYSISSNINDIKRKTDVRKNYDRSGIAMYRFLPDQKIVTKTDTVKCKVLEFVSVPKSAKIAINNTEESTVENTITKLYITHIEKFDMDIVFHREAVNYEWTYSKDIKTGKITRSDTKTERVVKRMIAFRKH